MTGIKIISVWCLVVLVVFNAYPQYQRIDSLNNILRTDKHDTAIVRTKIRLGLAYHDLRNDSALIYFQEALQTSINNGYRDREIAARQHLAFFFYAIKSDYATAMELYLKNQELAEQYGDTSLLVRDMRFFGIRDIGFIYERIEDYEKQLEYTIKLRDLLNSGLFKESEYINKATRIMKNRMGSALINVGMLDSARYYFRSLINDNTPFTDPAFMVLPRMGMGDIFKAEHNVDSAVYYYHPAIILANEGGRKDISGRILNSLADLYYHNKRPDSAFYYAHVALAAARQDRALNRVSALDELLAKIYKEKGLVDSAYYYLNEATQLNDSIASNEKLMAVQNLGLKRELKEQQEEQNKQKAISEYRSTIRLYGLGIVMLFILVVAILLFRSNRQKHRANLEIEHSLKELKNTQTQLIHAEKMASLGELTAGIAHEIQNPLNFVNNFSELNAELIEEMKMELAKGNTAGAVDIAADISENEKKINHHGKRADSIVKGMLQHSRSSSGQKELTDINVLVDECMRLSYHGMRAKDKSLNAKMEIHLDPAAKPLLVIPQDIGRVLLNLLTNAFYSVTQKARTVSAGFDPCVRATTNWKDNGIEIKIHDNGVGVPQRVMDKIFQPFFTTKPTGEGTGLGLSMSYDIVTNEHGGLINVESKEGEFATFTIFLPANPKL